MQDHIPRIKNMYIILTTPVALILLVYSIYKWIMRQSNREKEFWIDQKVYGHPISLKLYALMKAVLFLIAIGGVMLILFSLVYGQVPTWRDFSNRKFFRAVCGAGFFIIVQFGSPGLIRLVRHVGKFNIGKVILFFLLIGIITAILLAGICIAAF